MERQTLPKKIRFEVFKRDGFRCQYCGRMAPDVILEVDHIIPVAEGGENDILNLITSCRDCNRGKGKTALSDDAVIKKQQKELQDLHEKQIQMEMMIEWRKGLRDISDRQVEYVNNLIDEMTGWGLSENGKKDLKAHIRNFGFEHVCKAAEISFQKYYLDKKPFHSEWQDNKAFSNALQKIGGICYNWRKEGKNGNL